MLSSYWKQLFSITLRSSFQSFSNTQLFLNLSNVTYLSNLNIPLRLFSNLFLLSANENRNCNKIIRKHASYGRFCISFVHFKLVFSLFKKLSFNPAPRKIFRLCFFCSFLYVSLCLSWKMLTFSWIDLAQLDSELTKHEVDSNEAVSHNICAYGPSQSSRLQLESLRAAMENSYRVSKIFFEFRPLSSNFSNDQGFTSFGAFAKNSFGAMRFCLV